VDEGVVAERAGDPTHPSMPGVVVPERELTVPHNPERERHSGFAVG
jgi:hypothetical protein